MVPKLLDLAMNPRTTGQMRSWTFLALQEITDENLPADALAWSRWYQEHGSEKMAEFERLRAVMTGFPVLTATTVDHLAAASVANACRAKGIAASTIDCLIAAQAIGAGFSLFTLDEDFVRIANCCGLVLWSRPGIEG